jgi:uncharacterized membrane protein
MKKSNMTIRNLAFTGVIAAVSFVAFTFLKIPMPGTGAVHLGNAVVVLGSLLLGGFWGGLGGALGMTVADLMDARFVIYAPTTFILKFAIGLITGFIAHRLGKINEQNNPKMLLKWTILAAVGGLTFNFIFSPLVTYFYNRVILSKPAADLALSWNILTSGINALASIIVSVAVYLVLRPALKKSGFFM